MLTLLQASNNIEYDVYNLGSCSDTGGVAPGLQGWYIYALSIYASIIDGNNGSLMAKCAATPVPS